MSGIADLCARFMTAERSKALKAALAASDEAHVYGLAGSAPAMMLAAMPARKHPVMVVGDSLDDAGYLYHDLSRILGDDAVLMFPSAYKRSIKYGQVDPPSEILRTEALNRWHSDKSLRFVVTYPEAMAEKVASRSDVDTLTLRLARGSVAPMTDTARWLRDNGFQEVDYVYEPGQFAIRGSILDIFGYSYEMPYRLDFFGDEIDSIRTFNTETQLSEQQVASVAVTANVASSARGESLLDFIPADTLIAVRDAAYTLQRIEAVSNESFSQSSLLADEGDADAMQKVVDPEAFAKAFVGFARLLCHARRKGAEGVHRLRLHSAGCLPQEFRHHIRVAQPFSGRRVLYMHPLRQPEADRSPQGHICRQGRRYTVHAGWHGPTCRICRSPSEAVCVYRPPDFRPFP